MEPADAVVGFLIGIILVVGPFVVGSCYVYIIIRYAVPSLLWPKTTANIASCSVQSVHEGSLTYATYVSYRYQVDSVVYEGTRIRFLCQPHCTLKSAESERRSVLFRNPLYVSYNPKDPSVCVIYPGLHGWMVFWVLFSVIMHMLGWFVLFATV